MLRSAKPQEAIELGRLAARCLEAVSQPPSETFLSFLLIRSFNRTVLQGSVVAKQSGQIRAIAE